VFSARVGVPESKMPDEINPPGILFWRRPIDSLAPARSPATLAGLTVYLAVPNRSVLLRQAAFRRAVLRVGGTKRSPALWLSKCWVLATSYSRTAYRRTTIGAAAFHFRVRNENGWGHRASVTRAEERLRYSALVAALRAA
jgi:hypothetical protein